MKKIMLMTMALLALAGNALAQGSIRTSDLTCQKGEQVELPLEITNDASLAVVGISFTLALPEGVSLVIEDGEPLYELNSDRLNPKRFTVYTNQLDDGSWGFRVSTNSATAVLNGTEGEVMTITLAVADDMEAGDYSIKLTDNKFSIRDAGNSVQTMPLADATSTLTVESSDTRVVLDENSTTMPEAATGVDVLVKRTIKTGNLSTICLPFAMTGDQAVAAFGADAELADFAGYETTEDDEENITAILVKFTALDIKKGMKANHPYVIKIHTDSDVKEFTAEGVDIEPEDDPTVAAVKRTKKQWSELIGTYVADTKLEATTIFLNANKFWYSAGETKIKAFRAYFDFYDVLTDVESALSGDANIRYVIEEATSIRDIATDNAVSKGWFTIDGRKLNGKPAQKGIYILNGKKVRL